MAYFILYNISKQKGLETKIPPHGFHWLIFEQNRDEFKHRVALKIMPPRMWESSTSFYQGFFTTYTVTVPTIFPFGTAEQKKLFDLRRVCGLFF